MGTFWRDWWPSMNFPTRGSPTPTTSVSVIEGGIFGIPCGDTESPSLITMREAESGFQCSAILAASRRPAKRSVFPTSNAWWSGRSLRMFRTTSTSRVSTTTGLAPL